MSALSFSREERRVVAIVLLAFIPFALAVAVVVQRHTESARAGIMADRLAHARAAANVADSYIAGNISTLHALSRQSAVQAATVTTANDILAPVLRTDPNWFAIGLSDADGFNITSFAAPPRSVSVADRDYFQDALRTAQPAVGSVIIARGGLAQRTVVLAVPIDFADGTRGVLSGALSLARAEQLLREAIPAGLELRVVDRRAQEFIGPSAAPDAIPVVSGEPDIRLAMAGGSGASVVTRAGVETLVAFATVERAGWSIVLDDRADVAFAVPQRETYGAVALTIAGLASALAIAWYFGRRLARSYGALEHARAEAETERARLREAVRNAPARVGVLLGPDLRFAVVSAEALRTFRLREEDVLGRAYRELDPNPERIATLEKVYRTGEPHEMHEARAVVRLPNGATQDAYFNSAILPIRDPAGRIDGLVYHGVDVTALVQARQRVEELAAASKAERDELQQVVDAMPEGVVVMRADGSVIRNLAANEILGHTFAEPLVDGQPLPGAHPRRLDGTAYTPEDTPIVRALRGGELVHGEQLLIHNATTGADIPVLVSAAPLRRNNEIVAAVSVFQDISALKALEAQRTEFFTVASHEIKTPITAIQLQLDLANRLHQGGQHARVGDLVRRALVRTRDLVALVNDLLAVSRIDAGRFALEPVRVDLRELVQDIADGFPTDETHPIHVTTPSHAVTVDVDRRRVVETLENLLTNAVKYSPEGGAIGVELAAADGRALVRVRDRGFGVPPEERAFIFERFFRTSRAKSFGGVGLGLYISREIMERHGGSLELESTGESGSTFLVALPLIETPAATAATSPSTDR